MSSRSLPAGSLQAIDAARAASMGTATARPIQAEERGWVPWTAAERESFFDAIARHRRASWRITCACVFAIGVLALVMAVMLSPLLVSLIALVVDVINIVVPMPNVFGRLNDALTPLFDERTFSFARLLATAGIAAIPGLLLMGVLVLGLNRALKRSPLFDAGELTGRAPTRSVLAEQRLINVIEEMALAASIPPPQVRIVSGGINAAVFGRDESHTTILVGEGLLESLNRSEMQGAVAHLIGSIAGGDMPIGMRTAVTFSFFGLLARLSGVMGDRAGFYNVARLVRTLIWPTRAGMAHLLRDVADPFSPSSQSKAAPGEKTARNEGTKKNDLTWREWAMMPLMGPVWLSGFLGGMVSTMMLNPLVSFAWRRRKYMADAAAVRLTRDPDTLASMLQKIIGGGGTGLHEWTLHMAIAGDRTSKGLLSGSIVSIFPSTARRYRALGRLGATLQPMDADRRPPMPLHLTLVLGALGSIAVGLFLLVIPLIVWLSAALSMLFTMAPAGLLHLLLRALGH